MATSKQKEDSYDQAIARAEAIVSQLEQAEAISMDEFKRLADEANALLQRCKDELKES